MKISIRYHILMALISFVVITVIVTSSVMLSKFNEQIAHRITHDLDNTLQLYSGEISNAISRIQSSNDYISVNEGIVNALKNDNKDVMRNISAINEIHKELKRTFNMFLINETNVYSASFFINSAFPISTKLSGNMNIKNVISGNSISLYSDNGLESEDWYKKTVEKNGKIYFFRDEQNVKHIFFSQLINNNVTYNDEVLGISLVGIDLKQALENFKKISSKEYINTIITDRGNNLICESANMKNEIDVAGLIHMYESAASKAANPFVNLKLNNQKCIVNIRVLEFGLKLISVIDENDINIEIKEINMYLFSIIFIILIAVTLIAGILSKRLAKPVKLLANKMNSIVEGSDVSIKNNGSHIIEINMLNQAFCKMLTRIKDLLSEARVAGIREKEMEIKMLQAQINPHFLYNALDSIAWMALKRNEDDIADMITALSDGFRYSVKEINTLITIQDEVAFIKSYLKLQELRYNGRFIFEFDFSKKAGKLLIPKFIIQPLVENSIIHGLKRGNKQITIKVNVFCSSDVAEIYVIDDGNGFDAEKLNEYLDGNGAIFAGEKIGTKNVNKRLKCKYGAEYGLSYVNNDNGGLTAIIKIPALFERLQ